MDSWLWQTALTAHRPEAILQAKRNAYSIANDRWLLTRLPNRPIPLPC